MRHKRNDSETNAVGKTSFYLLAFVTVITAQGVSKLATHLALRRKSSKSAVK